MYVFKKIVKTRENFRIYVQISGPNSNFRTNFKISGQRPGLYQRQNNKLILSYLTCPYVPMRTSDWPSKSMSAAKQQRALSNESLSGRTTSSARPCSATLLDTRVQHLSHFRPSANVAEPGSSVNYTRTVYY